MTIAVIQARMSSSRLPGKVLKKINNKPLLAYLIDRLKQAKKIDKVIIATTKNPADNQISEFAKNYKIECYRGSESDVLSRFYNTVRKYNPNFIVRITADCPLIDPKLCNLIISEISQKKVDYVCLDQTFAEGVDCEVFTYKALKESYSQAIDPQEKEHVTLYIHNNPKKFKRIVIKNTKDDSQYRFTIDELPDFKLVKEIFKHFNGNIHFSYNQIINYLEKNPKINKINSRIVRNEGYLISLTKQNNVIKNKNILLRVDGSENIGWGHVMRCIGLSEELKSIGFKPIFIIKDQDQEILNKIKSFGFDIELIPKNIPLRRESSYIVPLIAKYSSRSLILDVSHTKILNQLKEFKRYLNIVRKKIKNIVLIDGYASECIASKISLPIDILVIPYIGAENLKNLKVKNAKMLFGTNYSVIRTEFLKFKKSNRKFTKVAKKVLILPGGSSNTLFIKKVIEALNKVKVPNLQIKVVSKNNQIKLLLKKLNKPNINIETIKHNQSVAPIYNWADFAISASGITMYEMAFMGLGSVVISHNKSHLYTADKLMQKGSLISLGTLKKVTAENIAINLNKLLKSKDKRKKMSIYGKNLIDGKGAKRIVTDIVMMELLNNTVS